MQCFDDETVDLSTGELTAEMFDGFGSILAGMNLAFVRPPNSYTARYFGGGIFRILRQFYLKFYLRT